MPQDWTIWEVLETIISLFSFRDWCRSQAVFLPGRWHRKWRLLDGEGGGWWCWVGPIPFQEERPRTLSPVVYLTWEDLAAIILFSCLCWALVREWCLGAVVQAEWEIWDPPPQSPRIRLPRKYIWPLFSFTVLWRSRTNSFSVRKMMVVGKACGFSDGSLPWFLKLPFNFWLKALDSRSSSKKS